jgi:hypothetical protein
MQRHRVGIFTYLFCPYVGFPHQPFHTESAVAGSTRQEAGTSNAGREFASRIISTCFNRWSTTGHAVPGVATVKALPRLSTTFTGRKDILKRLAQDLDPSISSVALRKQRIFVLYGLGGAGKTQIMAKFVDEFGDQYDIDPFIEHRHSNYPHPHLGSGISTLSTQPPSTPSSRV